MHFAFFKNSVRLLLAGLVVAAGASSSRAAMVMGSQGVSSVGTISADTGDINTATVFTIGSLLSSVGAGGQTGDFLASVTANEFLGGATLDLANPASFSFGNATFGTFTAATLSIQQTGPLTQAFYLLGTFAPGSDFGTGATGGPASFTISFTQNGGPGTGISASGTLSIPPAPLVPEPASLLMLGLGLAGVAGAGRLRRKAA